MDSGADLIIRAGGGPVAATLTPPKTEEYRHLALEISFTGSLPSDDSWGS
jgi:hypothetical protein